MQVRLGRNVLPDRNLTGEFIQGHGPLRNPIGRGHRTRQPIAGLDGCRLHRGDAIFHLGQPYIGHVDPIGQERAPARRIDTADRPFGKERFNQFNFGPEFFSAYLIHGDELQVNRRKLGIVILEAGEASLTPETARSGRRAVERGPWNGHRIGRYTGRNTGRPAPERVVGNAVGGGIQQSLIERADRDTAAIEVEPVAGPRFVQPQFRQQLVGRPVKEFARHIGIGHDRRIVEGRPNLAAQ